MAMDDFSLEEAHRLKIKRGPKTEPWGTPKQHRWEMNIHPDHHICAGFLETVMREEAVYAIVNFACNISCSLIQSAQCFFTCPSHESSSTECKTRLGKPGFARSQVKPVCEIHRMTRMSKPGRLLLCSTAYSAVRCFSQAAAVRSSAHWMQWEERTADSQSVSGFLQREVTRLFTEVLKAANSRNTFAKLQHAAWDWVEMIQLPKKWYELVCSSLLAQPAWQCHSDSCYTGYWTFCSILYSTISISF